MIYSFQENFLFTHVSRTGGVAIRQCLEEGGARFKLLGSSQHAGLFEARGSLGEQFDTTFKFAMVRNPWDRMLSWYSYIIQIDSTVDPAMIADPDAQIWKGFDAYLETILSETTIIDGVERLSMSQYHQLSDAQEELLVDRYGRFESLQTDFEVMMKKLAFRHPPFQKLNASTHGDYRAYYSDAGRELVSEKLAKDIETFAYVFG